MDKGLVLMCIILHFQVFALCDEPQKFEETCIDVKMSERMNSFDLRMNSFDLSCDNDYVMTYVNATIGVGSCALETCAGITPSFIVQLYSCYWKNNCTVTMPTDIIVKVRNPDDFRCFGEIPTFLRVSNVRCFKPYDDRADKVADKNASRVIDICQESQIAFDGGIIRSHTLYPWDYGFGEKTCELHMYVKVGQPLTITVQDNDLGELDSLSITSDGRLVNLTGQGSEYSQLVSTEGSAVDIMFKTDLDTAGGRGFLICFSFNDVIYKGTNACNAVTKTGSLRQVHVTEPQGISFQVEEDVQTTPQPADENCKRRRKNGKCRGKKKRDKKNKKDRGKGKNKKKRGKKGSRKGKRKTDKN